MSRSADSSATRDCPGTGSSDAPVRDPLDMWGLPDVDAGVSVTQFGARTREIPESVLVPIAGGPNSGAAVDVSLALARSWNALLRLMTVVSPGDDAARMRADARLHNHTDDLDAVAFDICVRTGEDVVAAITNSARTDDLTVVGGSERSLFHRLFAGTVPEQLAERSETPLLVVERDAQEPIQ